MATARRRVLPEPAYFADAITPRALACSGGSEPTGLGRFGPRDRSTSLLSGLVPVGRTAGCAAESAGLARCDSTLRCEDAADVREVIIAGGRQRGNESWRLGHVRIRTVTHGRVAWGGAGVRLADRDRATATVGIGQVPDGAERGR